MTTTNYEVLDTAVDGLRIQVEVQAHTNYSLACSGIPFIRAIVVHNESRAPISGIELGATVTLTNGDSQRWSKTLAAVIPAGAVARLDDPAEFATFSALFARTNEATEAVLEVTAELAHELAGLRPAQLRVQMTVSAANEWLNLHGLQAALAAFVQPNARTITGILRFASELLHTRTGNSSLDGYQSGSDRARAIAAALYDAVRALEVTYVHPKAPLGGATHTVRTSEQVLRDQFGTSVDLSVLFAACLEASGLFATVFLTDDHAFSGFYSSETYGAAGIVSEANTLANMVESGLIVPLELTGVGPDEDRLTYTEAASAATVLLRSNVDTVHGMLDVTRARLDGVHPMPPLGSDDVPTNEQTRIERPFVLESSLKSRQLAAEEEVVRGVLEQADDSPARFKNWKRDLLDLTLRNPLLNMPRTQRVLELVVPDGLLPMLDDVVHSGKGVRLAPGAGIASETMVAVFDKTRTAHSALDDDKHRRQLRSIKREADTLEQESGSNYLYLTLGALVHTKDDGSEARAPLFLLPVRLTGGLAFTPYSLSLDGEELAQPNLCLLQWLKTTRGVDLTALSSPSLDDSGLALSATLAAIRRQLLDAELPYRIEESSALAILRFSTFQIWKDLDTNWRSLLTNPVVQHLVETPGETFQDPAGSHELMIDETSLRLPIAADGSQMAAIVRATSGQSFVLEGPPGTGKSQTITNLIAHALTAGKKVLFVAEKQAALEVVKRRLDAIGLGSFGLELHGSKQSMKSIRDQLRASLELRVPSDTAAWDVTDARLRAAIGELTRYPELLHAPNAHGHSLWSAYDATATLGEGPTADIAPTWLTSPSPLDATLITRDFAAAAAQIGLRPGYRWLLSGITDPAVVDLDELRSAQSTLAAARAAMPRLSPALQGVLGELLPGAGLRSFAELLAARENGLLPGDAELRRIEQADWAPAAEGVREQLAHIRSKHDPVLGDVLPDAFDAPDLAELIARSKRLDATRLLPGMRRGALRKRIDELAVDGVQVDDSSQTVWLSALQAAAADAAPIRAALASLGGTRVAAPWHPYSQTAVEELDAAIVTAQNSLRMAHSSPAAWELLLDAGALPGDDVALIRSIDSAWQRWLKALSASALSLEQWARTGWPTAWERDEPLWASDLETTGALQLQRFAETRRLLGELVRAGLPAFSDQLATATITPTEAEEALLRGLARTSLRERTAVSSLDDFDGDAHNRAASAYLTQGAQLREQLRTAVAARLIAQRPFDAHDLHGEVAELARQIERKRGGLAFREVARRFPRALTSITPCFLMSPGSVAHFLDADSIEFDLVIFDEASQIRVPQAIGAMGRGKAVIVVGDSKQMPPTRIMQVETTGSAETGEEDLVVEDLESILTEAVESGLPQLWLGWHYRSQDESLIAFSNTTYYDDKLVSLPSPHTTSDTGLSWRRVNGLFDRGRTRTNDVEAVAIVDEIRARLADPATADDSLGVVCFNIQQRDLILNKLEDSADPLVQKALTAEPARALFVKNLENVQGDERDTILFSLAFSLDPATGRLPLNFGPLGLGGGERRLNVAVTRARKQIVLFSSFDPADIDLTRTSSQGITDLRRYLEFASTRTLARGAARNALLSNRGRLIGELSSALIDAGYEVQAELGLSSFRVDLAVRAKGDEGWRMAVMVDGPAWASRPTVSDRDGSPQLLVDLMGWPVLARVWLPGWLRDRDGVLAGLIHSLDGTAGVFQAPTE